MREDPPSRQLPRDWLCQTTGGAASSGDGELCEANDRGGATVGVFDSGIGGLSVLKALRAALPRHDFIYVADSGHAPYGERDEAYVVARTQAIAAWLVAQDIQALVLACNTATAAAVHLLRAACPRTPIVGLEPALKPAVASSQTGHIGVIATRSTLASAKFRTLHASLAGSANFTLQACDGLAGAIERSASSAASPEIEALCARYLGMMGSFGSGDGQIDTLVLGCTHYPFVADTIGALAGGNVRLVDTGEAVARQTVRVLAQPVFPATGSAAGDDGRVKHAGNITLLTTGEPALLELAAARWLGLSTPATHLAV